MNSLSDKLLHEIHEKSIQMALYVTKICEENGLLIYLCGGGCIGAVRNGGFVPWDDDLDMFMPREDYQKLIAIWDSVADTEKYRLQVTTDRVFTRNQFATVCDNNTTFIKSYQKDLDINHGLQLDILPLDGCPKGFARKTQKIYALLYSLFIIGKAPGNHGAAVRFLGGAMLTVVFSKKLRTKIWQFCEKRMTRFPISKCERITELCAGPHYMQNEYPKAAFEKAVKVPFDGVMLPVPTGYDAYLSMAFGDYMTPPPPEKQVCHHDAEYIDMHNSYLKYKGIYYCKKG